MTTVTETWILASSGNRWVENFFRRAMQIQRTVLDTVSEDKRKQGYGRAAKAIVDGPNGGIFQLWFAERGIEPKPPEVPIKNTVYMTEETLLNLITPDVDLDTLVSLVEKAGSIENIAFQLYPRLDFRTALANRLVVVGDEDKADVDSEEWAQIIEKFLLKIAFPIVIRGLLRKARERRK